MDINLIQIVRVSVVLFVALILPFNVAFADGPDAQQASYDSLLQDSKICDANQDYSGAFDDELQAILLDPTRGDGVAACIESLSQNTPETINLNRLAAIPAGTLPLDIITSKTEPGFPKSDDQTVILVPNSSLASEMDDPVEDWPFERIMYVYSVSGANPAILLCSIHYQTDDVKSLGERIGSLLVLLDKVYADRMVISRADDSYPFHVWLCETAPVSNGGEQWRNNIYFYDVSDVRSSIEWIREIAHEFSHLAFPAVGGSYTDPEAFANGYLGERLLVRWLSRGTAGGETSIEGDWKGTFAGYYNFDRLLIAPPIKEFRKYGLDKAKLNQRDAEGTRYLIGMMLAIDDRFGSATVGTLLQGLADQHSSDPNLLYNPVHALITHLMSQKQTSAAKVRH